MSATEAEQEAEPGTTGRRRRWCLRLGGIAPFFVLFGLLLHPTQVTVRQLADLLAGAVGAGGGLARMVPSVGICVSDLLFLAAFVMWLAWRISDGSLRRQVQSYPRALVAVLIAAALSALPFLKHSALFTGGELDYARASKEFVQLLLLFVCTFAVLADYLRDPVWRNRLVAAFLIAALACLLVGVWQYGRLRPSTDGRPLPGRLISPVDVDGTFGFEGVAAGAHEQIGTMSNRNVLGAWISLVLPLLWGIALWTPRPSVRGICGASAWAGLLLLLNGGLWAATLAVFLLLSYLRGGRAFAATAVGLLVLWAVVFRFGPQEHGLILTDSLMLRRGYDRFHTLPVYGAEGTGRAGAPAELSAPEGGAWQQKYIEWQPGLQALARNPLFGVGVGNYQNNINAYYQAKPDPTYNPQGLYDVPKPSANLMETGANSFYLVWGVETGLAGLFALLWVLLFGLKAAGRAAVASDCGWVRGLAWGCVGALCAMAGGMLFTNYLVRGVGIAVVFVLALCAALGAGAGALSPAREAEPDDTAELLVSMELEDEPEGGTPPPVQAEPEETAAPEPAEPEETAAPEPAGGAETP